MFRLQKNLLSLTPLLQQLFKKEEGREEEKKECEIINLLSKCFSEIYHKPKSQDM